MAHHDLKANDLVVGHDLLHHRLHELAPADDVPAAPKRRQRRPSLVVIAKQAARAGIEVARYEVDVDGKIIIVTGKPDSAPTNPETGNEWDRLQ